MMSHRLISLLPLALFRSFFLVVALATLDITFDLGTSLFWLCTAATFGALSGTYFPVYSKSFKKFLLWLLVPYLLLRVCIYADAVLISHKAILSPHSLLLHLNSTYFILSLAAVSTWLFWRYALTTTLEILAIITSMVTIFSKHRDYNLVDLPQFISALAWHLGTDIPSLLIMISTASIVLITAYLILATSPHRPFLFQNQRLRVSHYLARTNRLMSFTIAITTLLILAAISRHVLHSYNMQLAERGSNGVGMASDKEALGSSPLGFHSALGSNNQPAALVRLEGDYIENPFSPMLYLREGALSGFDGREMVTAGKKYDTDVPFTNLDEQYLHDEDLDLTGRVPIEHSVYLLAEHKKQFAIDYPVSISPIKNPSPDRFKAAYKVYSIAPAFDRRDLNFTLTGDPRWSEDTQAHYLKQHSDPRYKEFAEKLTLGVHSPAEKGLAIVDYLNRNAIYTLTPNHEVDEKSDPVAPFLFGDLRGYCVHFAHATVYMLRSLGIPARVATGYLTDLSQARDGHILLRMSDRHAWAEMYLTGRGWIPFDTQPEQVESHADTQVDMQLLEELMGLVGPEEEFFTEDLVKDEPGLEKPEAGYLPDMRYFFYLVLLLIVILYCLKFYLRYAWLFSSDPQKQVRYTYRSILTKLQDLGMSRFAGETRNEYSRRIDAFFRFPTLGKMTGWYNVSRYSLQQTAEVEPETLRETFHSSSKHVNSRLTPAQRLRALLNPLSALSFLAGDRI